MSRMPENMKKMIKDMFKHVIQLPKRMKKLGSTFPQTREMPGPTEQKEK